MVERGTDGQTTIPAHMLEELKGARLPRHVAIIMDGNGRWAFQRGLPRSEGHRAGAESVRNVVEAAAELGLGYLTLYSFSTENWRRPPSEIRFLMGLLRQYLREELPTLMDNDVRLRTIGRIQDLPFPVRRLLRRVCRQTESNGGLTLTLALSYGSRAEIVDAVKSVLSAHTRGCLPVAELEEAGFASHLASSFLPDPDLIVRTSGEMRLSNFLLWQAAYSEIYVTDIMWPDFGKTDFGNALLEFSRRKRRFGGLSDAAASSNDA
jgi:undecaprenyl diphosphate synthase